MYRARKSLHRTASVDTRFGCELCSCHTRLRQDKFQGRPLSAADQKRAHSLVQDASTVVQRIKARRVQVSEAERQQAQNAARLIREGVQTLEQLAFRFEAERRSEAL